MTTRLTHADIQKACGADPSDKEMECPLCHHKHLQLFAEDDCKCQNGCDTSAVIAECRRRLSVGEIPTPHKAPKKLKEKPAGKLTLADYGLAKNLSAQVLEQHFALTDGPHPYYPDVDSVCMPYLNERGEEVTQQHRWGMEKGQRRYLADKPTCLYAGRLFKYLEDRAAAGDAVDTLNLPEGESNVQTLVQNGYPALGLPGVRNWRPEWAQLKLFQAATRIYLWLDMTEEGQPEAVALEGARKVAECFPPGKVLAVKLPKPFKDVSALWLFHTTDAFGEGINGFRRDLQDAILSATPVISVPIASTVADHSATPLPANAR